MGGMEVRIGGKSRRLARFESPRRDLLPRPRLARVGLVVRALSLLGSARSLSPSVAQLSSRPGREKSECGPENRPLRWKIYCAGRPRAEAGEAGIREICLKT